MLLQTCLKSTCYDNVFVSNQGDPRENENRDFMKYLARKREQEKMDLRRKLQNNNQPSREQYGHDAQIRRAPQQIDHTKQKPAGYEERRRMREMEKRRAMMQQGEERRDADVRVVRSRQNMNEHYDYNNRGRPRSRSGSGQRTDRKHSRESSESRRRSRDSSETRRSRDVSKRKSERTRSNSRDSKYHDNKRRKQRGSSDEGNNTKPPSSNLRELEFRARALQSLINKKEASNKAIESGKSHRRGDR